MMPTTDQQRRALTYLTRTLRDDTYGAGPWDEPGIMAALTRVRGLDIGTVAMAAMRAAADPTIKTPAMIGDPSSSVYVERVGREKARRHPSPASACATCGRDLADSCCDAPAARPVPTGRYPEQASAARALLHEESK